MTSSTEPSSIGPITAEDAPTGPMLPAVASLLIVAVLLVLFYDWVNQQVNDPRAVAFAERALAQAPQSASIMDTLAWILVERGDKMRRAISLLRKATVLAPNKGDIRYHLAYALNRNGENLEARRMLEELLDAGLHFSKKEAGTRTSGRAFSSPALHVCIAFTKTQRSVES